MGIHDNHGLDLPLTADTKQYMLQGS